MLNFITTGCSFTAGTIPLSHNTANDWAVKGSIWNHFCFAKMNPEKNKFINLALGGGSNISSTTNLVYYLETNKQTVTNQNTLIGLNITGLDRYDSICRLEDPLINNDLCCIDPSGIDHVSKELGFGWITHGNKIRQEHTDILNCMALLQCFSYLDLNNFSYFFMLMNNAVYNTAPGWFKIALDQRKSRWVTFDDTMGMMELVLKNKLTRSPTDWHPNIQGSKLIAKYVIDFLKKNQNYDPFFTQ